VPMLKADFGERTDDRREFETLDYADWVGKRLPVLMVLWTCVATCRNGVKIGIMMIVKR